LGIATIELDGITTASITTTVHIVVAKHIAVIIQNIVTVYTKLLQLASDEIDFRQRIAGLPQRLMIELSFPFSYNMLSVELKSFYEALFCVYECLNITYFCILL
jgi:hypothetical protein